jgi:hypothetical protein
MPFRTARHSFPHNLHNIHKSFSMWTLKRKMLLYGFLMHSIDYWRGLASSSVHNGHLCFFNSLFISLVRATFWKWHKTQAIIVGKLLILQMEKDREQKKITSYSIIVFYVYCWIQKLWWNEQNCPEPALVSPWGVTCWWELGCPQVGGAASSSAPWGGGLPPPAGWPRPPTASKFCGAGVSGISEHPAPASPTV